MACKCQATTKIMPAACAWVLLLSSTGLFFAYPCWYLMLTYSFAIPIVQGIITFFVISNFTLATFMNPGIIPKAHSDETKEVAPFYKDIEIKSVRIRLKWCVTCQFYRPPRCTHCGICDSCIETFDHHCPWVNNCIGRRNYRFFVMFLLWLSVHVISIFGLCLLYMSHHLKSLHELPTLITIIISVIIIVLFIPIMGLTIYHVILISRGRTTNEQVTEKFRDIQNPYSRGCCNNIFYSLCSSPYPSFNTWKTSNAPAEHGCSETMSNISNSACQQVAVTTGFKASGQMQIGSFRNLDNSLQSDSIVPNQSHSQDCEPSPPPYHSNKGNLYLNLSQSVYRKQTPPYQHSKSSRALTPPVSAQHHLRFDHSRRSLPPQNRLHALPLYTSVAQSIPNSAYHIQSEGTNKNVRIGSHNLKPTAALSQQETAALYHLTTPFLNSESHQFLVHGIPRSNLSSVSTAVTDVSSFTASDFTNTKNTVDLSDTCCLGNQTVDKLQEIANKTAITGQLTETCVQEAFNKRCGNFHTSHNRNPHEACQFSSVNSLSPINVIGNPCVDCQRTNVSPRSSQTSMEQIIPHDLSRTPGRRPLSFVKAMEMSEALDGVCADAQSSYNASDTYCHNVNSAQTDSANQVNVNTSGREVSYEICV